MKKTASLIMIILTVFLSSCNEIETVELSQRLIIESLGIDVENNIYKLTVEGLDSLTAGSDSNSISAKRVSKCYMFEGESIGDAVNKISSVTGLIPLFSQARVLILGKTTAENYLTQTLDYFCREYTTRSDILIAVAEKNAYDIISADYGANVSAGKIISESLLSYKYTGKSIYMPLYKFLNHSIYKKDSACCPLINVEKNKFSEISEIRLKGSVIFGKNNVIKIITPDETRSILIIRNRIENADINVNSNIGFFTLKIINCKTKIKTKIINNKAELSISTNIRCDIPEYQQDSFDGLSENDIELISDEAAKKILNDLTNVLSETLYKYNLDVYDFCRLINLHDNKYFEEYIINNENFSDNTACNINIELSIRRIGKVVLKK